MDIHTACQILGVDSAVSESEAAKAYRDLIRVWHPDNFSNKPELLERATAQTKLVNQAWETLSSRPTRDVESINRNFLRKLSRESTTKTVIILVLGLLMALAALGWLTATDAFNPSLRLTKELAVMAEATNLSLPLAIDEETTFTATFAGPGLRFTSVHTIMRYTRDEIGSAYFQEYRQNLIRHIRTNLPTSKNLQFLSKNNVTLAYSYKDKDGADVITLVIEPTEYQ